MLKSKELQKLRKVYPTPSKEEKILVHVYKQGAFSPENAIKLEKSIALKRLLKQGQLSATSEGRIYLTDEGRIVVGGVLKLYPELKVTKEK